MNRKPTYKELANRVLELEKENFELKAALQTDPALIEAEAEAGTPPAGELDLASIINLEEIQSIMDEFDYLTGKATAILDLKGKVIEATGWQELCTRFHRKNPHTACNCTESDLFLTENVKKGEYLAYKCRNGLWDVVTPLFVGSRHLGNIFTGQFFYDDEEVDEEYFTVQAERYGFDRDSYLEALRKIPRYSRETIDHLMSFLIKFTTYVSNIGLANLQLVEEIRERKKAQEALRNNETLLKILIRTIPDLVWLKDKDGIYLLCNSRFEEFFGATEEEIVGKSDYDFLDKELVDFFRGFDLEAMAKGGPNRNEEEVVFASDGHREILETIKTPMYASDGQFLGILGIGRDITDRTRAEEEKKRLEEQYFQAQKVESIGRLAGGVAHDLNNLLSPIIGYSEMILDYFAPGDTRREAVEEILRAGFRARDLVGQLLAFGRKQTLEYKPLNLNEVIEGFRKLLERTIPENIEVKTELSSDIPIVMADIRQIEQVIMNLVVNAADAMPKGGELVIETSSLELGESEAGDPEHLPPGSYVELAVSDTGIGMDEEIRSHLFEPFFSTKGEQGTGLGLATVYGIVKQHEGDIRVCSRPGKGASFRILLPASRGESERIIESGKDDSGNMKGTETILLVEDNDQVRKLVGSILKKMGYSVVPAGNGSEAMAVVGNLESGIDLLLTDVVMPGMNGKELYCKIRETFPGLKVLYMSGYAGDQISSQGVLNEGKLFIQKPFNIHEFTTRVREILDHSPS